MIIINTRKNTSGLFFIHQTRALEKWICFQGADCVVDGMGHNLLLHLCVLRSERSIWCSRCSLFAEKMTEIVSGESSSGPTGPGLY